MLFSELNLNSDLMSGIHDVGYEQMTDVQVQVIPHILNGRDVLAKAKTGTGKTAAFGIPLIEKLLQTTATKKVRGLVVAPTRELAIQIGENFEQYATHTNLTVGVMYGGVTPKRHIKVVKREPDIIVSTPGRILDFVTQGLVDLSDLQFFVLDEADQLLDESMLHIVRKIIALLPNKRQNLLFSATMPKHILKVANSFMKNYEKIVVADSAVEDVEIKQYVSYVEEVHKTEMLLKWLKETEYESVMIFVRTKKKADKLSKVINVANIRNKAIHGDKSQSERQKSLALFKDKEIKILVTTDVAARGIDIDQLSHVINFNIPNVAETYIHRIGRTGRAGKSGIALSLCSTEERDDLKNIEVLQQKKIEEMSY